MLKRKRYVYNETDGDNKSCMRQAKIKELYGSSLAEESIWSKHTKEWRLTSIDV